MKTIFVSIASYRDVDINNTIDSLFHNAEHPDSIHIGVFLQIDLGLDKDCTVVTRPGVSVITIDPRDAKGAGYARSQVTRLYNGEDYFFQIDSHMRFAMHWDSKLIEMIPDGKSILSTYPLPFTPPNDFNRDRYVVIAPKKFDVDGVLLQSSGMYEFKSGALEQSPFISAGMFFAPRSYLKDVPIDPNILFTGEEISTGIRLWTHGYDVYIPNKVIAYHNYNLTPERPRIWVDQGQINERSKQSRERVLWLCRQKKDVSIESLVDIDLYGLGHSRSLESFEEFSRIDFKNRIINT